MIECLVNPSEKRSGKIQDLSCYSEHKNEHKKVKKPQKIRRQKKRLSRKDAKELGLYCLPRKTLKYTEYLPLNELWNSYMTSQFGSGDLQSLKSKFDPAHPQYDQISSLIHKSDYHGAILKVTHSKCASLVGHKGILIMDTKGTFSILGKDNILRVIPKNESIFELKWNKVRFTVYGKHLCFRSAERATKKVKCLAVMDL